MNALAAGGGPVDPAAMAKLDATNAVAHPERSFTDPRGAAAEITRLRGELAKSPDENTKEAVRARIGTLRARWVDLATKAGIPKPTRPLDPINATPQEIANAYAWYDLGGVIPASELQADGGQAFASSVLDVATRQTQGFEAMLKRHSASPDEQKALLRRELTRLGDTTSPGPSESVSSLTRRRFEIIAQHMADARFGAMTKEAEVERKRIYMGLDGVQGTSEQLELYERTQRMSAAVSDSTAGSILATYLGGGDIEKMRSLGALGSAAEGVAGGAAAVIEGNRRAKNDPKNHGPEPEPRNGAEVRDAAGRATKPPTAPAATTKPASAPVDRAGPPRTLRTGPATGAAGTSVAATPGATPPAATGSTAVAAVEPFSSPNGKFRTTEMNPAFRGEDVQGNRIWRGGAPVQYCGTNAQRAKFKLEIRSVTRADGTVEKLIFGPDGKPFDTGSAKNCEGHPRAIFVMNADGELFASTYQERGKFHHSTLAGGQPVAAAGELVVENGRLKEITNNSGHYRPSVGHTQQALASLQNQGVNLSGVKMTDVATKQEKVFP